MKAGHFNSGRAVLVKTELAKDNLKLGSDEILKLALTYASHEGISHIELVQQAEAKLNSYKDELIKDLEQANRNGTPSIATHLQETKTALDAVVRDKAKIALSGWVNKEKVYSGSAISPSLKFLNTVCNAYDDLIQTKAPQLKQRFEAAYESMESDNPSHWANAVHECRKVLEDLADVVFPAQDTPVKRGEKEIGLGKEQFVNRIATYVESKSDSKSYERVVATHLSDFGAKLDALAKTTQKGSHAAVTKEHAALYISEIYLLVGGVLSL